MTNQPPTVFVVDDEPSARKSLCALAKSMGLPSAEFASAEAFLASYEPDWPGCLITDVRMLGISGIELQEKLRERNVEIPIIVITAFADTPLTVRAMQNGAVTLLEKPCRDQELWEAIRVALQRDAAHRELLQRRRAIQQRMNSLTPQERQVLDGVVAGKPNKIMARELDVSIRTVEARRHHVFQKMNTDSVADLVKLVLSLEDAAPRPDWDSRDDSGSREEIQLPTHLTQSPPPAG